VQSGQVVENLLVINMQRTTAFFAFLIVLMMSTSAALTAVPAMAQAKETVFTVGWGAAHRFSCVCGSGGAGKQF
jgi:hypothetical protein